MKEAFKLYFRFYSKWMYLYLIVSQLALGICNIYLDVLIPTSVAQYFTNEIPFVSLIIRIAAVVAFNLILCMVANLVNVFLARKYDTRFQKEIHQILFRKMHELPLSYYDDASFFEKYKLASENAQSASVAMVRWLDEMLRLIASAATATLVITLVDANILLIMLACLVVSGLLELVLALVSIKLNEHIVTINKISDYIGRVFYLRQYQAELRTSCIRKVMFSAYDANLKERNTLIKKLFRAYPLECLRVCVSDVIIYFVLLGYACYNITVLKVYSASNLVALLSGALALYTLLSAILNKSVELFENRKKFAYYQQFMALEKTDSTGKKLPPKDVNAIVFDHVSFGYGDRTVLCDVSLKIPMGSTLAIVGPNGAGKSTLLKLLLGYYPVSDGSITINRTDIAEFDADGYRELFGFVSQHAEIFEMSVAENILLKRCETAEEKRVVRDALNKVGLLEKICSLRDSIDTVIGKEFADDGVLLSGGELQRLTLARAIVQNKPILLVDEPSSHIDPVSEKAVFTLLKKINTKGIVIFITHNIKNAAKADNIVWVENGTILEEGSHADLMELGGKYATAYNSLYNVLLED